MVPPFSLGRMDHSFFYSINNSCRILYCGDYIMMTSFEGLIIFSLWFRTVISLRRGPVSYLSPKKKKIRSKNPQLLQKNLRKGREINFAKLNKAYSHTRGLHHPVRGVDPQIPQYSTHHVMTNALNRESQS